MYIIEPYCIDDQSLIFGVQQQEFCSSVKLQRQTVWVQISETGNPEDIPIQALEMTANLEASGATWT